MSKRQDIDHVLKGWKYEPGEVVARLARASDGRQVLQMRIDLGVLQLEVENRPDGTRPGGADVLRLSARAGPARGGRIRPHRRTMCRGRPRVRPVLPPSDVLASTARIPTGCA